MMTEYRCEGDDPWGIKRAYIERDNLRAENAKLREALKQIASRQCQCVNCYPNCTGCAVCVAKWVEIT